MNLPTIFFPVRVPDTEGNYRIFQQKADEPMPDPTAFTYKSHTTAKKVAELMSAREAAKATVTVMMGSDYEHSHEAMGMAHDLTSHLTAAIIKLNEQEA